MSNFAPNPRSTQFHPYSENNERMEGAKANFTTSLMTSEVCMDKCNLTDASSAISGIEGDCLRQCFVKYFDCRLLIQNENANFVRGLDL